MYLDRVKEYSISTGTSNMQLLAALTGYQRFVDVVEESTPISYCIVHRTSSEWEVGIGHLYVGPPNYLCRDIVLASSDGGTKVNFNPGYKDIFSTIPADLAAPKSKNLLLNPCFETVLQGTHTATIITHGVAETEKNTQFPGWQGVTPAGSPSMDVDVEGTIVSSNGKQSCKVSSVTLGTDDAPLYLEQRWNATNLLAAYASNCRSGYLDSGFLTFALNLKLTNPVAGACRIGISVDGGSNYTYSIYSENDNAWQRLLVSVDVGTSATDIRFRIAMDKGSTIVYYFDSASVVFSKNALTYLPFEPRPPIVLEQQIDGLTNYVKHIPGSTSFLSTGGGSFSDQDCNVNNVRPPWANVAIMMLRYIGGLAASTTEGLYVKPADANNEYFYLASNTQHASGQAQCPIGKNGQLELQVTNEDSGTVQGRVYFNGWRGVDL